jgi:VWFA-related protein
LTALNDALFLAMSYLRNARGRPILVVFTDGVDNASWVDEEQLLESARLSEVVVYAIRAETAVDVSRRAGPLSAGGSSGESVATLDALTRLTGGRSIGASQGEVYARAFEEIVAEVNTRYVLAFTPPDDARPGWHELRVKVRGVLDADVRARAGYFLPGE